MRGRSSGGDGEDVNARPRICTCTCVCTSIGAMNTRWRAVAELNTHLELRIVVAVL